MRKQIVFTSESATEGHPDKIADQISDTVLDACLEQDPMSRVACETMVATGLVMIAGEITTKAYVDLQAIARGVIAGIGYDNALYGFDSSTCAVISTINKQSPDIAMGVDTGGAGDQGMVFGYATDETAEFMPAPISLAHRLAGRLSVVRKNGELPYLRPDGKSQVTVEYDDFGKPLRIESVVISAQHSEMIANEELRSDILKHVIQAVLPYDWLDEDTKYHINPTGRFVIGGPMADTGITGRQIVADTYGGTSRHGGGTFSGKDATKVDRSAAYMARYIAKNVVAAGLAQRCEVQLAYAIGVAEPISVFTDTFGTGVLSDSELSRLVRQTFSLTPKAIIERLDLRRPIFRRTSVYGHFGRSESEFSWETVDAASQLVTGAGHRQESNRSSANINELLLTLTTATSESRWANNREIELELESIARSNYLGIEKTVGEVGGSGIGVITGSIAGLEHSGIVVGVLAVIAAPLSAVVGAWLQSRSGRKVRLKVGREDIDIEANSSEEIVKLLEMARQSQKDMITRVIIDR
jgi:S-adenosylmethionine synthetase